MGGMDWDGCIIYEIEIGLQDHLPKHDVVPAQSPFFSGSGGRV